MAWSQINDLNTRRYSSYLLNAETSKDLLGDMDKSYVTKNMPKLHKGVERENRII